MLQLGLYHSAEMPQGEKIKKEFLLGALSRSSKYWVFVTQQLETNSNQHDLAQLNLNKPFISMSQYF